MNPRGSVSFTSTKLPCPATVIVTITSASGATESAEKDLLALGALGSGVDVGVGV